MQKGRKVIIAFEGIDGVGKSTQLALSEKNLEACDKEIILTKEPGGTAFGRKIREIIFHEELSFKAEFFLFLADRSEHYERVLKKHKDKIILSDRTFISGIAYACVNEKSLNMEELFKINAFALNNTFPDKVIFLKADEELIQERLGSRKQDRIESRGRQYLLEVQDKIEELLEKYSFPYLALNAREKKEELNKKIMEFIK